MKKPVNRKALVAIALNSRTEKAPAFLTKGIVVESTLRGFTCYFHNGSFYWVENGTDGWKQPEGHRIAAVVYAIKPGTDKLSYGSATHWDRHPVGKGNTASFALAEAAIKKHYTNWKPMDVNTRPLSCRG